ncbi:MAG: DUF3604 domain-containing protein [Mucilaginibacter sp.]|uniref:DUF3604 domain-containing protein n=1 Tax=Mucilaginibacter sp. TaxID=1882438 RepID=UPI00319F4F74
MIDIKLLLVLTVLFSCNFSRAQQVHYQSESVDTPQTISQTELYSKYASAATAGGKTWVSFTSSKPGFDGIYVSERSNRWSKPQRIDHGSGSENFSSILTTKDESLWVFWQGTRDGRTGIYASKKNKQGWQTEQKITRDSITALHPKVINDQKGNLWLIYEKAGINSIVLEAMVFNGHDWSSPKQLSKGSFNRRASLATDPDGSIWLAWDSPVSGNYDIWLTQLLCAPGNHKIVQRQTEQVTHDAGIDDSPALAMSVENVLWVAWNSNRSLQSEANRSDKHSGAIFLKGRKAGKWIAAGAPFKGAMLGQVNNPDFDKTPNDATMPYWHWKQTQNYPNLFCDKKGKVYVFWRSDPTGGHNFDIFMRAYNGQAWSNVFDLTTFSPGRDEWPQALPENDKALLLVWQGQELPLPGEEEKYSGGFVDAYNTRANHNVILSASLNTTKYTFTIPAPSRSFPAERISAANDQEKPLPAATRLIRYDSVASKHLFYGDLHAHSVLSDAKYGWPDQLFYLARFKNQLDYMVVSDHAEMGLLQRSEFEELSLMARIFSIPANFVGFSGFEWTGTPEYGHRIVIFPGLHNLPLSSALPEGNTIEKLYAFAKKNNAVLSAHHTAQATWGRWNPNAAYSPKEEPNFEIASWHGRFEYYNNPMEGRRQVPGHQFQDIIKAGRHSGILGGSDTHFLSPGEGALNMVWADSLSRSSVFNAIAQRHTYATTGAVIGLQFHINGQMMGSEFKCDSLLHLQVIVQGTSPIDHIEIVKDAAESFALIRIEQLSGTNKGTFLLYDPAAPQGGTRMPTNNLSSVTFNVTDKKTLKISSYYVRVTQTDGQQAWSSPIWVN